MHLESALYCVGKHWSLLIYANLHNVFSIKSGTGCSVTGAVCDLGLVSLMFQVSLSPSTLRKLAQIIPDRILHRYPFFDDISAQAILHVLKRTVLKWGRLICYCIVFWFPSRCARMGCLCQLALTKQNEQLHKCTTRTFASQVLFIAFTHHFFTTLYQ